MEEQVKLRLPGIDKEWVRSSSGEWVDLASLHQPEVVEEQNVNEDDDLFMDKPQKRKWWKFWGR